MGKKGKRKRKIRRVKEKQKTGRLAQRDEETTRESVYNRKKHYN